jgi:hypothetical protein
LEVEPYDIRAYYNAVRNRWAGLGDYSNAAEPRDPAGQPVAAPNRGAAAPVAERR